MFLNYFVSKIMRKVQVDELSKKTLLAEKESLCIEHEGRLIGFYYPVVDRKKIQIAKQEMDLIMEQVLAETGLTEEEYVEAFLKAN